MKNICEKLFTFLLPLLFVFPAFKENISSIFFIVLSINTIFYSIITKNYKSFDKKMLLFTIPFWVLLVFCLVYFDSVKSLKPARQGLFFLLFPIIFSLIPKVYFSKEKIYLYITILRYSCVVIAFGFIAAFLYKYDFADFFVYKYDIPKFRDFVYNEITFFKIHPTYYTAVVILCTAFSFERVLKEKKYYDLIYVLIFTVITFLVLAKLNIVFLGILLAGMLLFRSDFNLRQKIGAISTFIILTLVLTFTIPGIKHRFSEMYKSYSNPPKGLAYDSTNIRVSITKCSIEVAKENYLFGVGFDNLTDELYECFKGNYDSSFYENHRYLTHNYFAYIFLSTGIIGMLFFLFYCYKVGVELKKINRFLLYVVAINVFFICLTEDYFYRHYGIFYFNLILMTFINYYKYLALDNQSQQ